MSVAKVAESIGVTYLTLRGFLQGKSVTTKTLDKIAAWTDKKS